MVKEADCELRVVGFNPDVPMDVCLPSAKFMAYFSVGRHGRVALNALVGALNTYKEKPTHMHIHFAFKLLALASFTH